MPYATDIDSQHSFIKPAIDKGYTVILLNSILDSHFVDFLDREYEDLSFKRIDSDTLDSLIEKDKKSDVAKISEQQEQELQKLFESLLPKDLKNANISISIRNMPDESLPVVMVQPEILRRFREMAALGGMEYLEGLKKEYTMIINSAHPLIEEILNYNDNNEKNKKVEQLIDLALISQNLLDGEKLTDFIKRSIEIMK